MTDPTPPTTAAGPRTASRRFALPLMNQMLLEAAESAHYMSAGVNGHPSPSLSFMECRIAECEKRREWAWDHTAEARQQNGPGLRSITTRVGIVLGMIEPMEREEAGRPGRREWLDVDEAWAILLDVRRDLAALAALPPSAPPALDPCPHCEQVVLTDGEHWVPNGGGWSCARLQEPER